MTPGQIEVQERERRSFERSKRTNAIVCVVIGVMFGLFALVCFIGAAMVVASDEPGSAIGAGVFGLFWTALAALLLGLGVRGLARFNRNARLRATGVRGTA